MSNLRRNVVKMPPARWLARMVEIVLGRLLERPREQVGPRGWAARREQAGPREWAPRRVAHVGARLGLSSAMHWARVGLGVTWLGPWPWCRGPWMARLGLW